MKNKTCSLWFVVLTITAPFSLLHAQIVPDGGSVLYTNTTNTFANITIGTNGSFTLFTLGNNALFTNSSDGVIGLNATAKSNEVRLISPTARWLLGNHLFVGSNGAFNRLVVSNGAFLRSANGYLGAYLPASNNVAIITGAGSTWSNNNVFYLGFNGAGNQLIVSNGGVLRVAGSLAGVNTTSNNNFALVTGTGSLWSNATTLQIGNGGPGNQLVISNGGVVRSSAGYFGGGVSASNTLVTVTGSGSLWTNATDFYVGQSSVGNRLLVSNGGAVRNGNGYVGGIFTGSNNVALITGAGSLWSNALNLEIGSYSSFNQAIASNGATIVAAGNGIIGPTTNGNGNAVTVNGTGSRWLVGNNLYVGSNGALSQLTITNGGLVSSQIGTFGQSLSSSNNVAFVAGVGSVWSNSGTLYLGSNGRANQLLISNGAKVQDAGSYVGTFVSSSNNLAVVAGAGSAWQHGFELYFGLSSAGNQLVISNGGAVLDSVGILGAAIDAKNNSALVTGAGSVWNNALELYVGSEGTSNRLIVSDGGTVLNSDGKIGALANDNAALVTGTGSRWTNALNLFIGDFNSRNQLVVSNGATVSVGRDGYLGYNAGANSNSAIVTGAGTRWLLNSNLYVGSNGALNRLVISNGALVANAVGNLGRNISSSNNLAVVTGAGSMWSNTGDLFIGHTGAGNQLVISNGGAVWNNAGEIGVNSRSNLALVTGVGSVWSNAATLLVGRSGSFNQLIVSNGGAMLTDNNYAYFSVSSSASNNSAVVTGPGSKWITFGMVLGSSGPDNRVVVTNGALVQSHYTYLGFDSGGRSSNNTVLVTGNGSVWSNAADFYVGHYGARNQLLISNGGVLSGNGGVYLGVSPASTNNRIEINGGSLVASNAAGNALLDVRRGTNVLTAGLVDVGRLQITNTLGFFEFNSGVLITRGTTNNNGRSFTVGNGTGAANFQLRGGTHSFANGLAIANNGSLTGVGMVVGTVNLLPGGTLAPGTSIGKLTLNNSPVLQGVTLMEISRSGSVLTNDEVQVGAALTYGGALVVTNSGVTPFVAGDRLKLFAATTYQGSFSSVSLPPLGFNLSWTNKLAMDGSIEVVSGPVPQFTGINKSGTNLVLTGTGGIANASYVVLTATNVAQPLNQWTSIATNQFGTGGIFTFTNGISPGTPHRFFLLRWP